MTPMKNPSHVMFNKQYAEGEMSYSDILLVYCKDFGTVIQGVLYRKPHVVLDNPLGDITLKRYPWWADCCY